MKKKYAFVLPYIGKLPSWFQLWLNSCARNPIADWLLFTDDHSSLVYPENVKVHYCSFEDLRLLFQKNFDFPISVTHPYRFCDFKPSYGEVFCDYLSSYEFWGHCDPDLIWGNLKEWLLDDVVSGYDRISHWGHCCLYRNSQEINSLYKSRIDGIAFYKDVYSNNQHIAFDEEYGMDIIARERGIKEFVLPFFDVKPAIQSYSFTPTYASEPFFPVGLRHLVASVNKNGVGVYGLNNEEELVCINVAYIHLQKRNMKVAIDNLSDDYLIVPNMFIPNQELNKLVLTDLTPGLMAGFLMHKKIVWKSRCSFVKERILK